MIWALAADPSEIEKCTACCLRIRVRYYLKISCCFSYLKKIARSWNEPTRRLMIVRVSDSTNEWEYWKVLRLRSGSSLPRHPAIRMLIQILGEDHEELAEM